MHTQLLAAFQAVDRHATRKDMLDACRQLFVESDEYNASLEQPFDRSEVDAVANAIYEYTVTPASLAVREIVFTCTRQLEGQSIEYCEYASLFSEDMLNQNYSRDFTSLNRDDLRRALNTFLVAILFRYRFCVDEDRAAFPVSTILDYMDGMKILFSREQRETDLPDALWATLRALESLEPRRRME